MSLLSLTADGVVLGLSACPFCGASSEAGPVSESLSESMEDWSSSSLSESSDLASRSISSSLWKPFTLPLLLASLVLGGDGRRGEDDVGLVAFNVVGAGILDDLDSISKQEKRTSATGDYQKGFCGKKSIKG